jgi:SpoVK/Ycf46/Vps4 family AAA+-type ATPase
MPLASAFTNLVQRFEPCATRRDLVLPKQPLRVLDQIALQRRAQTQETTIAAGPAKAGRAISALFAGPRGTGKTMAGEVLANETRLIFYNADLSRVGGSDMGETEKNVRALFDATREEGALLFFEEADALFGKRTDVRDAHQRNADLESNCFLQCMEGYRGIVILATHSKEAIDPAFLCRLGYVVDFALPDMAQRAEIWRRIFPPDIPVEALDPERLARLPLTGADIRDIARSSASIAAREGQPVRMSHLLRAAQSERAKIDRPIDLTAIARP